MKDRGLPVYKICSCSAIDNPPGVSEEIIANANFRKTVDKMSQEDESEPHNNSDVNKFDMQIR